MRRPAMNILLLVICCLSIPDRTTAGPQCTTHGCAGGNLVDELAHSNHLRAEGEEPEILKAGRRRERNGSLRDGSGGDRGDGQLKTKPTQVEDREEEEQEKEKDEVREESQRRNIAGTNRGYNIKYTLTMLKKILEDIERRLNVQRASNSSE